MYFQSIFANSDEEMTKFVVTGVILFIAMYVIAFGTFGMGVATILYLKFKYHQNKNLILHLIFMHKYKYLLRPWKPLRDSPINKLFNVISD